MPRLKIKEDHCTCAFLSWYGKGHSEHCAAVIVAHHERDVLKMRERIELMRDALQMSSGVIAAMRDRRSLDRQVANAAISHIRKLTRR